MKFKAISQVLLVATVLAGTSALAEENNAPGTGPNPFTDCGIGAALFKDTHWAAVTSNVIWDVGTTAVTSATASPETCQAQKVETAQFILDTYENLAEETAAGQGQHLMAALNKFGCETVDHADITNELRQKMAIEVSKEAYSGNSSIEKASSYYQALDLAAQGRCSA
ncbi:MAG: hypothetical protein ACJAWL_001791 [Motiliproteus sp.]|jgi:hypothetical protein